MNIRKLLAITLLATTIISQPFQMPTQQENNQLQDDDDVIEEILHQMHINQEDDDVMQEQEINSGNGSPVGIAPVSPIFEILRNNNVQRENEGQVIFGQRQPAQNNQEANQFLQFNAAALALQNVQQNQVRVNQVPQNSPENGFPIEHNLLILSITEDHFDLNGEQFAD